MQANETVLLHGTGGVSIFALVETVGGQNLQRSLNALRMGGHISVCGLLDDFNTSLNALSLLQQQATIRGMEVGNTQDFAAINRAIAAHDIHPVIDKTFTLEQTQAAFEYLEGGKHFGKVAIAF